MASFSGKKIHFIGIGGIGASALAQYFLAKGDAVSGSDEAQNESTQDLEKSGVKIFIGHRAENILLGTELVVYSAAVPSGNPELRAAQERGVQMQKYSQALGELTRQMTTIAVSGTHGKSTTTAMLGLIMEKAGLDPTVIVGTKIKEWGGSNFRFGQSRYLLIEADEYDRSFLNYWPKIIILTNVEADHLDTYQDLSDIKKTFAEYVGHLPPDGTLVYNEEDENVVTLINSKFQFSMTEKIPNSNFQITKFNSKNAGGLELKIPGQHNISNANAALTAAKILGIDEKIAVGALNDFSGTWRRLEWRGELNGAKIFDDYGHHPTEIKATLEAARSWLAGDGKLWCVFQPHQYQRTFKLFNDFLGAFDGADRVIFLPIYSVAGREDEEIKQKVNSKKLAEAIQKQREKDEIIYLEDFEAAAKELKERAGKGDVIIIMGAGNINRLTDKLLS